MYLNGHTHYFWKRVAFLTSAVLLAGSVVVAGSNWKTEKVSRDGISVYSRPSPGTTIQQLRAKVIIDAPPEVVLEAACDPKTFKETTEKYVETNKHFQKSPTVWFNYQLVDFPVIAKRDYTLRYEKITNPEKGLYRLNWRISKKHLPPPQKDVVRVTNIKGSMNITANKNGKGSTLRYTIIADPGGNIPNWLINVANRRSLPDILRQVRKASLKLQKKK